MLNMQPHVVNILIVDDDPLTCKYLAMIFSAKDWSVDTASNSSTALEFTRQKHYDAVVLDRMSADMDGAELCRRIKDAQPDIRSVFLTPDPNIGTVFPAMEAGAERVLAKPVDPHELVRALEEQLATAAGHARERGV
jgi:DNA-binding response OmpR family regulator